MKTIPVGPVVQACRSILTDEVYSSLISARIFLPTILEMAGKECFIENRFGEEVETIREAMAQLQGGGYFEEYSVDDLKLVVDDDIPPKITCSDPCPKCGTQLRPGLSGGVMCTKCPYWFCF